MNFELNVQKIMQIKASKFKKEFNSKVIAFTRRQKLSLEDCIIMLLNKKPQNMQTELDEYLA